MKNQILATLLRLLLVCLPITGAFAQQTDPDVIEVVCFKTNMGEFCIRLFPEDAPQTVANFLKYVNDGDYDGVVLHRSVPGFVVQTGGYRFDNQQGFVPIPKDANVVNEFKRSNKRGTVAMAKLGNDPNSATNEWFVNLADNTTGEENLDVQNGGFTVFGEVVIGMEVVDNISRLPRRNIGSIFGSPFEQTPMLGYDNYFTSDYFVTVTDAVVEQRDTTPPPSVEDPFPGVTTVATYASNVFAAPVQWTDGRMYRMIFVQKGTTGPPYAFTVDTLLITTLNDTGQKRAVFDGEYLTIPSVKIPGGIITDVRLKLSDRRVLEFTLETFSRYTGEQPL
jgi:peptidyl-prolyl cis-trans isomerase A (cyclophilin A)